MRLSRPRVVVRVLLLATGGLFMLWRAAQAWRASSELAGGAALLQSRIALVEALVGALALLTAIAAASSLRPRDRRASLRLPREPDPAPPAPREHP